MGHLICNFFIKNDKTKCDSAKNDILPGRWQLMAGWRGKLPRKNLFSVEITYHGFCLSFWIIFGHFRAKNQMSWPKIILMLHEETSLFLKWCKQFILFGRFVGNFAREISKTKQHCLHLIFVLRLGIAGGDWNLDTIIHTEEGGTPSPQQKQVDPCTFF